jgi:hypothetical protein
MNEVAGQVNRARRNRDQPGRAQSANRADVSPQCQGQPDRRDAENNR